MNLIDIIMPVYNAEKFIEKTLERLEKQEINLFRLILINDGSIDKTKIIIDEYLKKTKMNVCFVTQNNLGEGEARNTALKKVEADYVIFLDCDDYFEKDLIKEITKILLKRDKDIVFGSYIKKRKEVEVKVEYENKDWEKEEILKKVMKREISIGIGNSFIKRELLENKKYKKYKYGTDNHFFREILINAKNISSVNKLFFYYIDNPTSVMNKSFSYDRFDSLESILDTEKLYKKQQQSQNLIKSLNFFYNIELRGIIVSMIKSKINLKEILKQSVWAKKLKFNEIRKLERKDKFQLYFFSNFFKTYVYLYYLYSMKKCEKNEM